MVLAGALILAPSEAGVWTMAIGSAVVIWIGFVVPATVVNHMHRSLPGTAAAVDAGYRLVVMLVQALVLKAIGLTPPDGQGRARRPAVRFPRPAVSVMILLSGPSRGRSAPCRCFRSSMPPAPSATTRAC